MTVYYVDNAGSNTAPYDTWAKAANAIATIAALDAAGDTVYFASTHTETTAGAVSLAWAGTQAAPTSIIGGTTAAAPPTTFSAAGAIATSGANAETLASSGNVVIKGGQWTAGSAGNAASLTVNGGSGQVIIEAAGLILGNTNTSSEIVTVNTTNGRATLRNCTFTFASTSQNLRAAAASGRTVIEGGSITGSAITQLMSVTAQGSIVEVSGLDASAGAATMDLTNDTSQGIRFVMRDSKLPASWSGNVNAATPGLDAICEIHNCDAGDTHYNYARKVGGGLIVDETTLVRTGGATDIDGTVLSWKCTANANASVGENFRTGEIHKMNTTVGSAVTVTVDFLHDSATNLKNSEIWLEVMYLGTSGVPLGTWIADDVAGDNSGNSLATAADQASSSATWTTTGMSNPNKQKVAVTFTPQETGYIIARVAMATANGKVVYVDPKLQFS